MSSAAASRPAAASSSPMASSSRRTTPNTVTMTNFGISRSPSSCLARRSPNDTTRPRSPPDPAGQRRRSSPPPRRRRARSARPATPCRSAVGGIRPARRADASDPPTSAARRGRSRRPRDGRTGRGTRSAAAAGPAAACRPDSGRPARLRRCRASASAAAGSVRTCCRQIPELQVHLGGHVVRQAAQHGLQLDGRRCVAEDPPGQQQGAQPGECGRQRPSARPGSIRPGSRSRRPTVRRAARSGGATGRSRCSMVIWASRRRAARGLISAGGDQRHPHPGARPAAAASPRPAIRGGSMSNRGSSNSDRTATADLALHDVQHPRGDGPTDPRPYGRAEVDEDVTGGGPDRPRAGQSDPAAEPGEVADGRRHHREHGQPQRGERPVQSLREARAEEHPRLAVAGRVGGRVSRVRPGDREQGGDRPRLGEPEPTVSGQRPLDVLRRRRSASRPGHRVCASRRTSARTGTAGRSSEARASVRSRRR